MTPESTTPDAPELPPLPPLPTFEEVAAEYQAIVSRLEVLSVHLHHLGYDPRTMRPLDAPDPATYTVGAGDSTTIPTED